MNRFMILTLLVVVSVSIIFLVNKRYKEKKLSKVARIIISGISLAAVLIDLFSFAMGDLSDPNPTPTPISLPEVQSVLTMGTFEQDNIPENGTESVEWIVLSTNAENEVLLVSKYGLLYKPYEEEGIARTWGESSLHNWLNGDFYNMAFSPEEKRIIVQKKIITEKAEAYYSNLEDTVSYDFIFCLSIQEVNQFFNPREFRVCCPTDYAIFTFAGTEYHKDGDHWWLRNPGVSLSSVVTVRGYGEPGEKPGSINEYGSNSYGGGTLVRPAMWISWEAYTDLIE